MTAKKPARRKAREWDVWLDGGHLTSLNMGFTSSYTKITVREVMARAKPKKKGAKK
jgi:hypothetical protein